MDWSALAESISETLRTRLFEIAGTTLTLGALVVFVLVLIGTYIVSKLARRALDRWLKRSPVYTETSSAVAQRLLHYAILLAGFVVAMQTVGIDLSTLFAAGAVFAVGLGFAMQNVAQNFVSGVILMVERSIKPGDILMVEEQMVRVERMGIRSTIVRNRDEEELIVPNSILAQGSVKNYTLTDNLYLLRAEVGVVYGSDMKLVREVLEQTARDIPWRVQSEEPRILLKQFGSSSVDFNVFIWVDQPWISRRLLSDANERIWWALKEAGVTIAFPQVDVHLDPPVEESLRLVAGRSTP
jgi:small-conductance mechanosensitive channel